ncbi:SRPBCC family protein [Polaromonas sp.]|uniref:SRPBCC family protein n=1 Tax=Polaromonas sp. TaxID=1869339 RepID=UPI002FCAD7E9
MDMQGNRQLAVTQQQAWDALNDPEVLKRCIPGCDKVQADGDNRYAIGMALKIGPVAAKFNGKILLSDINPPSSYKLGFDGQGGVAGFGKGSAQVTLAPNDEGCELGYTVNAQVGGKIAQLGQRLIDGAAKNLAEDFFKRFDEEMQRQHPENYAAKVVMGDSEAEAETSAQNSGVPVWVWVAGGIVLAAAAWWLR